jgi:WD40 repeat protein
MNEKVLVGSWRKQITAGRKYPLNPVGEHEGYVSSLCFLGDDRNLVSGSGDSFVRVWDVGAKVRVNGDAKTSVKSKLC